MNDFFIFRSIVREQVTTFRKGLQIIYQARQLFSCMSDLTRPGLLGRACEPHGRWKVRLVSQRGARGMPLRNILKCHMHLWVRKCSTDHSANTHLLPSPKNLCHIHGNHVASASSYRHPYKLGAMLRQTDFHNKICRLAATTASHWLSTHLIG